MQHIASYGDIYSNTFTNILKHIHELSQFSLGGIKILYLRCTIRCINCYLLFKLYMYSDLYILTMQLTHICIIFNFLYFGPGVLACATRGGGQSEAGHCFHLLFSFFFFFFFYASCFSPTSGKVL